MRYLTILFTLLCSYTFAQQASCCVRPVSEQNAELALNTNFASKHLEPTPFKLEKEKGQMLTFKTEYGEDARAYRVTPDTQTTKVVFLFHEWWGLNDYIKQLTPIRDNLSKIGDYLTQIHKNSGYLIEDSRNELELKKDLYKSVTSGNQALSSALKYSTATLRRS